MLASASQQGCPGSNLTSGAHWSVTQGLIPVKPGADWGLTRGGARCQWPRGLVRASLALIKRATSAVAGVSPAATKTTAERFGKTLRGSILSAVCGYGLLAFLRI